ncbi:sel1 repeat family protein [Paraburkholderia sp. T12-10]|nr:sel1 repeat family protein [Paraburkholderia sp. T12-10]
MPSDRPNENEVRQNLAFSCTHESSRLPALNADADKLFMYARYLQKQSDPADFDDIMRYYRIAAAYGHYKANHNAQLLITHGLVSAPAGRKEAVDLAMQLVHDGIPGGYYDLAHYLETGYGVQHDTAAAMRYFRKAADLGSPEAQTYVADKLEPADMAPAVSRQMLQCASQQGNGDAATRLGINLKLDKQYPDALTQFQTGVAAGDAQSAFNLERAFADGSNIGEDDRLGMARDPERARRDRAIRAFVRRNDGRNPKVPDIDKIVPLPPAPLPAWDGTFQWEKEQAAAKPPEKPSDDLVNRMAKDKNLDPATGLPLSDAPAKTSATEQQPATVASHADRLPIGSVALTGDKCPEDGVWCANLGNREAANTQRRFVKGDTLPPVAIQAPRQIAIVDRWMGAREQPENVVWQLVSYSDNV